MAAARFTSFLALVFVVAVGSACGDDEDGRSGSESGGTSGASAGSGGTAAGVGGSSGGGACNTAPDDGTDVAEQEVTGTPPTMTGGALSDGTYRLGVIQDYNGGCNCTHRSTLVVRSGGTVIEQVFDGARSNFSVATSGITLTLTPTCAPAGTMEVSKQYTATSTSLALWDVVDESIAVYNKN